MGDKSRRGFTRSKKKNPYRAARLRKIRNNKDCLHTDDQDLCSPSSDKDDLCSSSSDKDDLRSPSSDEDDLCSSSSDKDDLCSPSSDKDGLRSPSRKKLCKGHTIQYDKEDLGNSIINMNLLVPFLEQHLRCPQCCAELSVSIRNLGGLAQKIYGVCKSCKHGVSQNLSKLAKGESMSNL